MEEELKYFIISLVCIIVVFISVGIAFVFFYRNRKLTFINEQRLLEERLQLEISNVRNEVQEQTLQHVCQELHDNIGQKLSVTRIYLNRLEMSRTDPGDKQELSGISNTLGESIDELRAIVNTLNPDAVKRRRLADALLLEKDRINSLKLAACSLDITGEDGHQATPEQELIIFRICQEFIQNSLKHSGCKTIAISLHFSTESLDLELADDGKGFDVAKQKAAGQGNGVYNMFHRADMIKAKLDFEPNHPAGTRARLKLPLP